MIKHVGHGMAMMLLLASAAFAQPRVEKNVVFGMYSGAALLMDVYHPVQSNGLGLIVIPGSGWYMPQRYDAPALKDDPVEIPAPPPAPPALPPPGGGRRAGSAPACPGRPRSPPR